MGRWCSTRRGGGCWPSCAGSIPGFWAGPCPPTPLTAWQRTPTAARWPGRGGGRHRRSRGRPYWGAVRVPRAAPGGRCARCSTGRAGSGCACGMGGGRWTRTPTSRWSTWICGAWWRWWQRSGGGRWSRGVRGGPGWMRGRCSRWRMRWWPTGGIRPCTGSGRRSGRVVCTSWRGATRVRSWGGGGWWAGMRSSSPRRWLWRRRCWTLRWPVWPGGWVMRRGPRRGSRTIRSAGGWVSSSAGNGWGG
ncbi:hypothetical protein YUMDRAFT_06443 [Streptomyces sp. OspMP-M45]|nr:hypothetical protein YUMDRAFT_06443 [Streptomyces sp. OspMP-M45]